MEMTNALDLKLTKEDFVLDFEITNDAMEFSADLETWTPIKTLITITCKGTCTCQCTQYCTV